VNKRVEERRQRWKKFGKCAGVEGIEPGATYRGEEVFLVLGEEERKEKERIEREKKDKQELEAMYTSMIAEGKKPGGPMLPGPIPAPGNGAPPAAAAWRPSWKTGGAPGAAPPSAATSLPPSDASGDPGRYVAPHKRSDNKGTGGPTSLEGTDYTSTIRVTNLSEETTENDLQDMFRKFGHVQRVYLVKDKLTNQSRGFAFITFTLRKDAQRAMEEMNGQGWDYLILSIEWAKPSAK